ncbi:MAG TPA: hypothetical protein VHO69_13050 [Phototrophicaceae bacterium]|nr:hypothetical protein [Phototrophicaceae bacterium]
MSLLRRIERNRMPQVGEVVRIFQHERLLAGGRVICADHHCVSVAGKGLIDLDTDELRRGLNDGSIRIERDPGN